jgi:hypothetical protein
MANAPDHAAGHIVIDAESSAMGRTVGKSRGRGSSARTGGVDLSASRPADDPASVQSPVKRGRGPRGRQNFWGTRPSDTRHLALPPDKPLTFREAISVIRRRRKLQGESLERATRAKGEITIDDLTTPELLRIVRFRAKDRREDQSGHLIPAGWVCSHPTLALLERESAKMLVDYWIDRGDLVVVGDERR